MCCCLCPRLHRHQIHLISYGFVSCSLIATGLVFTIFAIFRKDSQIGRVWLAGPTTMVVGLVLCGKVIIDWGPAMLHGLHGSIDSMMFVEQYPFVMANGEIKPQIAQTSRIADGTAINYYNSIVRSPNSPNPSIQQLSSAHRYPLSGQHPNLLRGYTTLIGSNYEPNGGSVRSSQASKIEPPPLDRITYQEESSSESNTSSYGALCDACDKSRTSRSEELDDSRLNSTKRPSLTAQPTNVVSDCCLSTRTVHYTPPHLCPHSNTYDVFAELPPHLSSRPMYQGETFVINERSYFI